MPAGTFLLEGRVEILDCRLVFPRVLTDLSHHIGLVAHVVSHGALTCWNGPQRKVCTLIDGLEYALRRVQRQLCGRWRRGALGGTDRCAREGG